MASRPAATREPPAALELRAHSRATTSMPLLSGLFVPPPRPLPPLEGLPIHVLGARGIGMSVVAIAAASAGANVDGCDQRADADGGLEQHGIPVAHGHDESHVEGRLLVATTVTPPDHPELRAALATRTAFHRSDLLAALIRDRNAVAVTGTHGKGTVAALVGAALAALGDDPLVLLGVVAPQLEGSVRVGRGTPVAEADEADGSIARIRARTSVVTNVSADHPQFGRTVRETLSDIGEHVARVPASGNVILGSGRNVRTLQRYARASVWLLGRDFRAKILGRTSSGFSIEFADPGGGTTVGAVRLLSVRTETNAALAYAALRAQNYAPDEAAAGLAHLTRLRRRLEDLGVVRGVCIYDDFGKHPACIAAALETLRTDSPRRLHAVYEPHREVMVRRWGRSLAAALELADTVVVLPLNDFYSGRRDEHASARFIARSGLRAYLARDYADAIEHLARQCVEGDVVCFFGVHRDVAGLAGSFKASLEHDATTGAVIRTT